jgi:uncharacterized protein (TIGR00299 family) protein
MLKTLHFDCFAGISGDMVLGALVDLGVEPDALRTELGKLGAGGWKLDFVRDERCGISGTGVHVYDTNSQSGGDRPGHIPWEEIRALIEKSALSGGAKTRSLDIFSRIARAESRIRGVPEEEAGFREAGAVDSVITIAGTAIALDMLKPGRITASELELGGGTVRCAHGVCPVPSPATLSLCRGLPVRTGGFQKEMATPVGTAILASLADEFISGGSFVELKTGYGIGKRKMDKPNVLRVSWREECAAAGSREPPPWNSEELMVIETSIGDMSGESLGALMKNLFASGALDVSFTPCVMQKSRPGTMISVLCLPEKTDALRRIGAFRETTVRRLVLERKENRGSGEAGETRTRAGFYGNRRLRSKIEYDDPRIVGERESSLEEAERRGTERRINEEW